MNKRNSFFLKKVAARKSQSECKQIVNKVGRKEDTV